MALGCEPCRRAASLSDGLKRKIYPQEEVDRIWELVEEHHLACKDLNCTCQHRLLWEEHDSRTR